MNGQTITLNQAYAHLHDNAERLLDRPRELRLLLVDREVPQEALAGLPPLPVEKMARAGQLQGLLFKLDPDNLRCLEVTLLLPPPAPGQQLLTRTINSPKPALKLQMNPQRVGGAFTCPPAPQPESAGRPNLTCDLHFSAPLFQELPVSAVLVGRAAQTSPQIQLLRAKVRALQEGDLVLVQRLSTDRANRATQTLPAQADPNAGSWGKPAAAKLQDALKHLQRVVVRNDRATAVFAAKQWQTFVRQGREWKIDN